MNKLLNFIREIKSLPKIEIEFEVDSQEKMNFYKQVTKPHPRYLVIKNKTVGVAIIKTGLYKKSDEYLKTVNGKNSAYYFSRKASKNGYLFKEINPNEFVDMIFDINTSLNERQGIEMGNSYKEKISNYPLSDNFKYFGIFLGDKLVAYDWILIYGELAIINRLLGHGGFLKDGIMYLLITSSISNLIDSNINIKFVMYDTIFGASDGLRLFKKRLGFKPYLVKWRIKK